MHELYPINMIRDAAQEWKNHVVNVNSETLGKVDGLFKDDVLEARVDKLVEDNYDSLALGIARLEMADFLNVEGKLEGTSAFLFKNQFQQLVTSEVAKYVDELLKIKNTGDPQFTI